jgi:PPOX class probable FMN-dependent enzyme
MVTSVAGLREIYRPPSRPAVAKQLDRLDGHCRTFIAHSPFVTLASADAAGRCDVSPRGGPPGFVRVLDDHTLALPDLSGNNRLDSLQNLVSCDGVGLLFLVPGLDETLRVNGRAVVSTDPEVLARCPVGDVEPRVAVVVAVDEAFLHCAKALRRSRLWDPDGWPDRSDMPSVACMLRDHYDLPEMDLAATERRLAESYRRTLWRAGGDTPVVTGD